MIKSMTGFGRGESGGKRGRFTVEVRTVNHRFFDLSSRLPNHLSALEDRIKKGLNKQIKRGKVNILIIHHNLSKEIDSLRLDTEKIEIYYKMLSKIKNKFKLKDDIKLANILSFPDVIIHKELQSDVDALWPAIEMAIKKAVAGCNRMREKEGIALYRDLMKRRDRIFKMVGEISEFVPDMVCEYKTKLNSRIRDILKKNNYPVDEARLELELAMFARQCDVSEELTRANAHLRAIKDIAYRGEEAGRRLDFILQELQREVNTLGAKSAHVKISSKVVDIKSEIEKMREQVQNIE